MPAFGDAKIQKRNEIVRLSKKSCKFAHVKNINYLYLKNNTWKLRN
jgi:hypothetical protein